MSLMNRNLGVPLVVGLLCTAAFTATGAIASEQADNTVRVNDPLNVIESLAVSYAPTDLTRPEAAQALYLHIQRAAKMVCHEPGLRDLAVYSAYQRCYDRAVNDAVEKVNVNTLTALHRSKTHSTPG